MSQEDNTFKLPLGLTNILRIFIWVLLIIGILKMWLVLPREFWQYMFFLRVPIIAALFLVFFPLIATTVLKSMLKNLFVLRGKWQLTFVIVGAIMGGMAIVLTANPILLNAKERFLLDYDLKKIPYIWQYVSAIMLGLPTCIAVTYYSVKEKELIGKQERKRIDQSEEELRQKAEKIIGKIPKELEQEKEKVQKEEERIIRINAIIGVIQGIIISVGLLFAINLTRQWLMSNFSHFPLFIDLIQFVTKQRTNGYLITEPGKIPELAPGHLTTVAFGVVELVVYLTVFFLFQPPKLPIKDDTTDYSDKRKGEAPALLYIMLILAVFELLLGVLSFYFDYFRFSIFFFGLFILILNYSFFKVDHFYKLESESDSSYAGKDKSSCQELCDFTKVLNERLKFQSDEKTLVIICASGGGIQAAGWTTQVLIGLHNLLKCSFTKSIGLISSVSGGSVGAMYYLDRLENIGCRTEQNRLFNSSTSDSLDATGWGLAYPDLWRLIGFPWLAPKMLDRGIALERDWQQEMKHPHKLTTLATWREKVLQGQMPIPIFNATLVENGKRFLISPLNFNDISQQMNQSSDDIVDDFNSLYGCYDLSVVTAARLSATFPYVSPICRPYYDQSQPGKSLSKKLFNQLQKILGIQPFLKNLKKNYHVADGGYFDNSGFVTVLEWLDKWLNKQLDSSEGFHLKRVILVQINAFPKVNYSKTEHLSAEKKAEDLPKEKAPEKRGLFMATIGPLLAMFKVRDPILAQRNATEIEIFTERWKEKVEINYYPIYFPQSYNSTKVSAFYEGEANLYRPPLSWKLTQQEKQAIKDAWNMIKKTDHIDPKDPNKHIKEVIKALQEKWEEVKQENSGFSEIDSHKSCPRI